MNTLSFNTSIGWITLSEDNNLIAYGNPFQEEIVITDTDSKKEIDVDFPSKFENYLILVQMQMGT